jgi:hypothetical protein
VNVTVVHLAATRPEASRHRRGHGSRRGRRRTLRHAFYSDWDR